MKNIVVYCLFQLLITSLVIAQNTGGIIEFEKSKQRFGFVHEGDTVKLTYNFKNTGNAPFVISEIRVTCGCTVVDFPKYPILPGEKGVINVSFDTHDKYDRQDRIIEVISNAKVPIYKLRFKGVIFKSKN